ncbi:MAG: Hsp20/alpha crystallin family protein [bacterium]|nr:Hsp20/alpha crystallin family protein [bacterium]
MAKKTKLKTDEPIIDPSTTPAPDPVPEPSTPEEPMKKAPGIFNPEGELVVDVFETNADFVVVAAIAGVQIKDLDISVEKDMMVIKGDRVDPHDHPEKKYFYQECYWGPFSRKIVLPENIDTEAANAQMDKGMLVVKIPKIEEKPKKNVELS